MNNFHDTLSPKIWTADKKLKPEVAKKLKEIAEAFIDFLDVPRNAIKDIVVTGSMASYNYTPQSDIDLHLLVDFDKVHKDCPIVGDFLISKKSEFNSNHDIFIYGIPVEVYAESIDNDNVHNGLYSLTTSSWIDEPKKLKPLDNDVAVKAKYKEFVEAAKNVKDGDVADKLIQKIKRMRKSGLAKEGEFSVENLVFKKLRNDGTIGKLMDIKKENIDKELSLKESAWSLLEEIATGISGMMGQQPNPVVGQTNPSKYQKQNKGTTKKAMLGYKYQKSRTPVVETLEEIFSACEELKKNTEKIGLFKDMDKDIGSFFGKADEFVKKQKEREAELKKIKEDK